MEVKKILDSVDDFVEYNENVYNYITLSTNTLLPDTAKGKLLKIVHCGRNTVTKYLNGDYGIIVP